MGLYLQWGEVLRGGVVPTWGGVLRGGAGFYLQWGGWGVEGWGYTYSGVGC